MNVRDMYMDNSGTNGKGSQDRVLRSPMMVAPQQTRFDSGVVSLNPAGYYLSHRGTLSL